MAPRHRLAFSAIASATAFSLLAAGCSSGGDADTSAAPTTVTSLSATTTTATTSAPTTTSTTVVPVSTTSPDTEALLNEALAAMDSGQFDEALAGFDEVISAARAGDQPEWNPNLGAALFAKATVLFAMGRTDDGVATSSELRAYFADNPDPGIAAFGITRQYDLAQGLRDSSLLEEAAVAFEEIVAFYDDAVTRFGSSVESTDAVETMAMVLGDQASVLLSLSRYDGALSVSRSLQDRFGAVTDPSLASPLAIGLLNMGLAHVHLGEINEAITVYEDAMSRYEASTDETVQDVLESIAAFATPTGLTCTVYASILEHMKQRAEGIDFIVAGDFEGGAALLQLVSVRFGGNLAGLEGLPAAGEDLDGATSFLIISVGNYMEGTRIVAEGARENDLEKIQVGETILIEGDAALAFLGDGAFKACGF